ncbi:LOW QUALITY PROTEIN: uncharacterized protein EMH_0019270 [Eimeria mitis]|uniref:Multiple myeloma tumor-associated protein 2-like N-terminal domain-containing protein n=1 Tax=Eimeria mitis TaxID=44415 RepID=U6K8D2_9EIME|nr:LOW QUALITY PROTEIN: uncharacterized protein EMH_0019270 [Eimeria mitis]CDJ34219.1 hypothetical protein EMH_0019270 [Eimeria mitis]
MAVYIKQSPPREGVRGGWEDFKWDSLKTQTNADRDYYLGEGRKPRHLLAGEALPDEEPPPAAATATATAVADDRRVAAKALKKLKKEQKKLKKMRKKEQRREAKRLRMVKRERDSDSSSSSRSRSSSADSRSDHRVKRLRGSPSPSKRSRDVNRNRRGEEHATNAGDPTVGTEAIGAARANDGRAHRRVRRRGRGITDSITGAMGRPARAASGSGATQKKEPTGVTVQKMKKGHAMNAHRGCKQR